MMAAFTPGGGIGGSSCTGNEICNADLVVQGNVGIGTTKPAVGKLEVHSTIPGRASIATHVPGYGSGGIAAYLGGSHGISLVANYVEDITFGLVDTDGDWSSTFREYMRIAGSSGDVGIGGFANIEAKLDVRHGTTDPLPKGLVYFGNSGANALTTLTLGDSGYTNTRYLLKAVADTDADAGGPYDMFAIRTDGNVGIGTVNPWSKLHITAAGYSISHQVAAPNSTFDITWSNYGDPQPSTGLGASGYRWDLTYRGTTANHDLHLYKGTADGSGPLLVMAWKPDGTIVGQFGTYHGPSDARLKKDILTIPNALEKVLNLRGVNFHWKDINKDQDLHMGMLAQEVEKVVPEVVHTADDEIKTKAVEYQYLAALLVEAVKEQQKQIEELKQRLTIVEKKN